MRKSYIASALFFIFLFSSCKKYLDIDPKDKLTIDQAFSSEATLQLYINGFYTKMLPTAASIYSGDVTSDITVPTVTPDYLLGNITQYNVSGWDWTNLRNVNYFLVHNNNSSLSSEVRNHYSGIARFFRAYFYFGMVKRFGDVPWYSSPLDVEDSTLYKKKDPRTLVMDSVLADINFACENIDDAKDNSCSNVTKWVALALKARICLFEGTFRKYHTDLSLSGTSATWLTAAADAAEEIINSGNYSLLSGNPSADYRSLFISETPVAQEVLLASVYDNSLQKWHASTYWYNSPTTGSRLSLDKYFVNTYLNIDGSRFTDNSNYTTKTFQEETQGRDYRLGETIRLGSYMRSDGSDGFPNFNVTITGYHILKFSLDDPYYDSRSESYNSIPIFRYAEVLLNYAEAMAELGVLTADEWSKTIGALRSRAGIENTSMPVTADSYLQNTFYPGISDAVLLEVRRERAIELACEGFRYDDLLRWKCADNMQRYYTGMYVPALNQLIDLNNDGTPDVCFVSATPAATVTGVVYVTLNGVVSKLSEDDKGYILWNINQPKTFDDYKYFYPIPNAEILLNPQLEQNEGWQ
ncbi:MAG: RagB/SusD family nutrient uptake outer membrane protein [Agriterribacter sp.]